MLVVAKKITRISGFRFFPVLLQTAKPLPRRPDGFTLLEVLLVLTIMAVASIFVVPNFTGLEARSFSAQVQQANSLLNYARRTAVFSGQASTVSLSVVAVDAANQDRRAGAEPHSNNVVAQWNGSDIELRFRDSIDREAEVEGSAKITFYPEGGSTGGALLFAQSGQLEIIDIDPFTGRISLRESED